MGSLFEEAVFFHRQGALHEAVDRYLHVLRNEPKNHEALNLLGLAYCQLGSIEVGIKHLKKCLKLRPQMAQAHLSLGEALRSLGEFPASVQSMRRAISINPLLAEAHLSLGQVLHEMEQYGDAISCYRQCAEIRPEDPNVHNHLGNSLLKIEQYDEAEACFRKALDLAPAFVAARNNLGVVFKSQKRMQEAEQTFLEVIETDPGYAAAYGNLARIAKEQERFFEAERYCRKALSLAPNYILAHICLADSLRYQGRHVEACEHYRAALALNPQSFEGHMALLFHYAFVQHDAGMDALNVAMQCGEMVARHSATPYRSWKVDFEETCLRVGLVSGDLREHPVGYFLENVLKAINPERVSLVAYPTTPVEDALTKRIRSCFSEWTPLVGLSDVAAAQRIRDDKIHILIDLSGYTAATLLPVFAMRAAPVQVSWLGYFATTGFAQMDYILADEMGVPADNQRHFSEKVWYLPETRLCFTPPYASPPVALPPALRNGFVTFASFQHVGKIGDDVLACWAEIMGGVSNSRLRLQSKQYEDLELRQQFLFRCKQSGIDFERIDFSGAVPRESYLEAYSEADLILDTFPYPGGTTTCEALWMGVPTVTLAGNNLLARQGASLLSAAGLEEWIAYDAQEYVTKARSFASDLEGLAKLRAGLRQQVSISPLFDAPRFARGLEDALAGMWQDKSGGASVKTDLVQKSEEGGL